MTTSYLKLMGAQRKVVYLKTTFCLMVDVWRWKNSKCSLKFCLKLFLFENEFIHSWAAFFFAYTSSHSVVRKFCKIQQNDLEAVLVCWDLFFFLFVNQEESTEWMMSGLWHKKVRNLLTVFPFNFPLQHIDIQYFSSKVGYAK